LEILSGTVFLPTINWWYSYGMETVDTSVLDRLLEPLAHSLTPDAARAIANFHADPQTQARIDELAEKCTEGRLTLEEREEYGAFIEAIDIVGIFQATG
jgi:hypothetical protein